MYIYIYIFIHMHVIDNVGNPRINQWYKPSQMVGVWHSASHILHIDMNPNNPHPFLPIGRLSFSEQFRSLDLPGTLDIFGGQEGDGTSVP
jgi:hypothetical protein